MSFLDKLKKRVEHRAEVYNSSGTIPAYETSAKLDSLKEGMTLLREKITQGKNAVISTPEQYTHRIEICRSCENFNSTTVTCKLCGCFMNLKTRLAGANCPINKW